MAVIVLLSLMAIIAGTSGLLEETSVSFYGGYYQETLPPGEKNSLTVQFNFRSLQESGVLLIATIRNSTDYIAVVLSSGSQLEVLLSLRDQLSTLTSTNFTEDFSDWQSFELTLVNLTLNVKLRDLPFTAYTFTAPPQVERVYLGGPESFFGPFYAGFPLPRHYVGCLANVTLNSRRLLLNVSEPGLEAGCCVAPRYPLWCLDTPHTNLTLSFPPPPVKSTTGVLTMSFRLRLRSGEDGLVMLSYSLTSLWSLQLLQGRLLLTTNVSSGIVHSCPGVLTASTEWHQVDVVLSSSSIACSVDGITETDSIFPSLTSSSFYPRLLQLGGVAEHIGGRGFVGCFQRPRVNGVDIAMSLIVSGEEAVRPVNIHWNNFSFNTIDLVVTERSTEKLSSSMWIRLPRDEFADDLTSLYQHELQNIIYFEVFHRPQYGHLYIGQPAAIVDQFDYQNILTTDPSQQVAYSHDNPDNDTDVIVLRVWAGCVDLVYHEEFSTLVINVEERDASLRIRSTPLHLAIGTQRVITPHIVTVEDPETQDPALVMFRVQFVSLLSSSCSSCPISECGTCEEGGVVFRSSAENNVSIKFFHQDDINRGVISFQHFEKYSTAPMVIRLGVGVEGNTDGLLDVTIAVAPYQGHINLTTNPEIKCVFVKEDGLALVAPKHLNVITDFEDQHPVITYDLLALPKYGILQRETTESRWLDLVNHTFPFGEIQSTSFTQADVNGGRVRYVQSEPFSFSDPEMFQFHVRSSNFSSNITANLCVNIIPYDILLQPSISVHLTNLVVFEGASAQINHTVFNTSLDKEEYLVMQLDLELDIHQLDVEYTLVDPPSFGRLELRGEILVAGDMFAHRDVTSSALVYFHGGTEDHRDQFSFYGETGSVEYLPIRAPNLTSNLTFLIDIAPVNDNSPEWDADVETILPPEGCWVKVTDSNINVTDIDRPANQLKIYLRKKGATPTGIFALRDEPDRAVAQFFMQDVLEERVIFIHHLNSSRLNYTQVLRIDDGNSGHTIRKPIFIAAVPLVLEVSLSLPPNSQCFGTIDADQQDLQVHFDSIKFTATLCDQFGDNPDLVPAITVTIVDFPQHGRVSKYSVDNTSLMPVSQFQFRDLSSLVYVLAATSRNESSDVLELEFTHGHSIPVRHALNICIQPALAPLSLVITTLKLTQGGMGHITTGHLTVTSSREEEKDSLIFHVVRGPQHGSLLHSDDLTHSLQQFTHGNLASSAVIYESHVSNAPNTQDNVVLRVCSPFSCLPQQVLPINIYATSLIVQNSTISVKEGGIHSFKLSDFNISAPSDYNINIVILKKPDYGSLFILTPFSNSEATYVRLEDLDKLRYENTILERLHDSVEINVEAETPEAPEALDFILRIVIVPVNHHAPEVISTVPYLTVVQGGTVLITSFIISAHDYDAGSDDDDLQWSIIYYPQSGYLFMDTDPGNQFLAIQNWQERDIRNNRLYYRNTNPLETDVVILKVSDGERETLFHLFIKTVLVNFMKYSTHPFHLVEGDQKRITFNHLRYYAANDGSLDDSDFLITIQRLPAHGQLTFLDSMNLLPSSHFTQKQINTSQLVYLHDHSNTVQDNFTFVISVPARQNGSSLETFHISIEAIDDDPPTAEIPERMFVEEMQRVEIDNTTFRILDYDSRTNVESDRVLCQLVQPLRHGRLEKLRLGLHIPHAEDFTKYDLENGKVYYHQLGLLNLQPDHLVFNLTDGINKQPKIYNLTIIILPRIISLQLSPLTVTENNVAVITYEEIIVNHPYLSTVSGNLALVEGSGPRHGTLINTRAGSNSVDPIRSFTTEDITNKYIRYFHNGDEGLRDSFQFIYEAREPPKYNRWSNMETFHIYITPVNDERPVIHNSASLKLWATETVLLDEKYFNITDYDTPPSKLNITFQIQTIGGYIAFANDTATSIHWFTQADVRSHVVMFVHVDGPEGQIAYSVMDGVHTETSVLFIFADSLALECRRYQWNSVNVGFLSAVQVTNANIRCTTSDELNDREITYHIPDIQLGHVEVNSKVRSEFNSTEISAGVVVFVHTETGLWMEEEFLLVSASSHPASPESGLSLVVRVHYPQPPPGSQLAVNTGLNITEGGSAIVDEAALDGRNLRYAAWLTLQSPPDTPKTLTTLYRVVQLPSRGNLTISKSSVTSFTQKDLASALLRYTHDGSETVSDTMMINVTVQLEDGTVISDHLETVRIVVTLVNDQRPILRTSALGKSLVRSFVNPLTTLDLEVRDDDNSPDEVILVLISVPNNTQLLLNGTALAASDTISQRHIDQQWVTLNPVSVGVSSFTFTFTDGVLTSAGIMEFILTVEDHYLLQINPQDRVEIVSFQNKTSGTVITSEHLNTSTNGYRFQTIFTVANAPCCGHIMLAGEERQTFTQLDIDHSEVSYVPRGETHKDHFSLNIRNRNLNLSVNVFIDIVVLGHTNEFNLINFTRDLMQVLPSDILLLDELKQATSSIPTIKLLGNGPRFGHLEMHVQLPEVFSVRKRATEEIREFRYDELQQGWIVYVWSPSEPVYNETVVDSFEVLVRAKGVLPGKAVITLTLFPPRNMPDPSDSTDPNSGGNARTQSIERSTSPVSGDSSGFPVYTLVPIIGIILFLLLLIAIVVAFCLKQQKKIKKKLAPSISHHHHQSPWSASSPPIPTHVAHYDFDPSGLPSSEDHHNSDTSSGFSEPDCSPRHTPIHSAHSPHPLGYSSSYHHPRSRMRSNVSITFSSRQSTMSEETSVDGDTFHHSSLSQYPPQTSAAVALPIRPASHTAFNRPLQVADSGMVSLNSGVIATAQEEPTQEEAISKRDKDDDDAFADWTDGKALPDFSDPSIQRLFHAHNPVLKKEEYWV